MEIKNRKEIPTAFVFLFFVSAALFSYFYFREKRVSSLPLSFPVFGFEDGLTKASQSKKLVLVDFYAIWCEPCKRMEQGSYRNPDVVKRIEENFIFVKVNIDETNSKLGFLSGRELSEKYSINAVPTHLVLNAKGKEAGRITGYHPPEIFLRELDKISPLNNSLN